MTAAGGSSHRARSHAPDAPSLRQQRRSPHRSPRSISQCGGFGGITSSARQAHADLMTPLLSTSVHGRVQCPLQLAPDTGCQWTSGSLAPNTRLQRCRALLNAPIIQLFALLGLLPFHSGRAGARSRCMSLERRSMHGTGSAALPHRRCRRADKARREAVVNPNRSCEGPHRSCEQLDQSAGCGARLIDYLARN